MNNYNISLPLMNINFHDHMDGEKTVETLKKMGVCRVFLALEINSVNGKAKDTEMKYLRENTAFLHSFGFEVGAWFWTFYNTSFDKFIRMVSPEGRVSNSVVCPTDEKYCDEICALIKSCAQAGVELIMFDDDFRYGFHDMGFGCLCENHLAKIGEYLGEKVDFDTVAKGVISGKKNKYRDAFLAVNGAVFEEFARKCRNALDEVDPKIRMGQCACITSWDMDGTTPDRLSEILAGNTKPFYRLVGAPYWVSMGNWGHTRLSYVIEQERLEAGRREDGNIEIFSEGDTYPRPRYRTPAAYLEGMDMVLRADGCTDGILKYALDYVADCDYEKGYAQAHLRNMPSYDLIDKLFSGKKTVGVRVFDSMRKFNDLDMSKYNKCPSIVQNFAFNAGARFLQSSSIPTVYSGNDYSGVAFGEDAKILTAEMLKNGAVIDYSAAVILQEKGIDTGIVSENGTVEMNITEYFSSGEKISTLTNTKIHKLSLDCGAEIGSFIMSEGEKCPVFYKYQNKDGLRFAVYTFEGYLAEEFAYRNYERQKQLTDALSWLCQRKLPAVCKGNPDLYILTKVKDNKLALGLWNFFPDGIFHADIELPENIRSFEIFGAEAISKGNILTVNEIPPYGFAAAEITFL